MENGPDVLEYLEYREFLRDWFTESKRKNHFTSYRYLGQRIGLDPAWIVRVFQKEGHLNEESVANFVRLCGFDERRAEYFRVLYRFCKTKSPEDQRVLFRRLMELREMEARQLSSLEMVYYADWATAALRALIGITRDTSDIESMGTHLSPPISAEEAQNALDILRKLGLVEPDGAGGWNITDRLVTTGNEVQSMAVRQHHRRILELAQESLERLP
ncbi:MAG TPA: TIGR02147 family protein, partial [Fibrobacteraceae bacterium]|nr:TIGR02147 family protein [Fibrobacteraceae bacterium]